MKSVVRYRPMLETRRPFPRPVPVTVTLSGTFDRSRIGYGSIGRSGVIPNVKSPIIYAQALRGCHVPKVDTATINIVVIGAYRARKKCGCTRNVEVCSLGLLR
jgi:hypothetical protein